MVGSVRQITVSKSKAVVTYYPRKTARGSYTRELIRQTNHVRRVAHISSLSTIFREMWQINSRSPCRNDGIVAVRQYDGGKAREVREMWPSSPIRSTRVDAADTRRDIADIGPHLALNVVIRRGARDAVISIQFVSRQQMQLTSGHETTLRPTRRLVGTDISRDISVESRTNIRAT